MSESDHTPPVPRIPLPTPSASRAGRAASLERARNAVKAAFDLLRSAQRDLTQGVQMVDASGRTVAPVDVMRCMDQAIRRVEEADLWMSKGQYIAQAQGLL